MVPLPPHIEITLGKGLTLSIAFLAKYIGLGGIPEKIKAVIAKVKKPVDKAVGKVTGRIADKVKLIVAKIKGGVDKAKSLFSKDKEMEEWEKKNPEKAAEVARGLAEIDELEKTKVVDDEIALEDAEIVAKTVQSKHSVFKKVEAVGEEDRLIYKYTVNPYAMKRTRFRLKTGWFKKGEAWEAIKNRDEWDNMNDARQTLNYRHRNNWRNEPGMEWHHVHEQSAGGPHSVKNLALTTGTFNQYLNQFYSKPQQNLTGDRDLHLRDWLKINPEITKLD
ncbi:MAG: hypothetical protein F9K24_14245 [Leptonema illini]|uniref:Uncharacterized protein n=1 Tax=Leptonema illini TaxID=183 RepID=A0A833H024_9LEPT|nr:MAG: hypothetical protein F9K24_14245 [Leptonema illini]